MAILQDMSKEQLLEALAKAREENERLKAKRSTVVCKVSDKGAVSVYGLGRFPVTLYRSQWERLIVAMPGIKTFIEANADRLTSKDD